MAIITDPQLDNEDGMIDTTEDHRGFPVQFLRDRRRKRGIRTVIIYGLTCADEYAVAGLASLLLGVAGVESSVTRLDSTLRRVNVEIDGNYDGRHDAAIVRAVRQAIWSHGKANQ